jgi:hypothetical protein
MSVQKHQSNYLALLRSVAAGSSVFESKIKHLRADNVALMTAAAIRVQQAGGTRFLLERLYEITHYEGKEARRLFNNDFASNSLSPAAKEDTATMMSSIMDSDGYTTVSHHGGSPTASPLKLRPQSRSPLF